MAQEDTVQQVVESQQVVEQPSAPEPSLQATFLSLLDKIAARPDFDADKVVKIAELQLAFMQREAEIAFNTDMALAQKEIGMVVVNSKNAHTGSLYLDITGLHEKAKPIWTRRGFSVVTYTTPSTKDKHTKVVCRVGHKGGHSITVEDDWPIDDVGTGGKVNKTAIQGKGSTSTYARRYVELGVFDVAISKMDEDGNPAKISNVQASDDTNAKLIALGLVKADGTAK